MSLAPDREEGHPGVTTPRGRDDQEELVSMWNRRTDESGRVQGVTHELFVQGAAQNRAKLICRGCAGADRVPGRCAGQPHRVRRLGRHDRARAARPPAAPPGCHLLGGSASRPATSTSAARTTPWLPATSQQFTALPAPLPRRRAHSKRKFVPTYLPKQTTTKKKKKKKKKKNVLLGSRRGKDCGERRIQATGQRHHVADRCRASERCFVNIPAEVIAKEREIAAQSDRLKGKPAQAMEKILQGVLRNST